MTEAGKGAVEGVASLISGLWTLVRHPIDSARAIANCPLALGRYLYGIYVGKVNPDKDIRNLAHAIYISTVSGIASDAHFSYQEAVTDEARSMACTMANWKLSGRGVAEMALLLAPIAKLAEIKTSAEAAELAGSAARLQKVERRRTFHRFGCDPRILASSGSFANRGAGACRENPVPALRSCKARFPRDAGGKFPCAQAAVSLVSIGTGRRRHCLGAGQGACSRNKRRVLLQSVSGEASDIGELQAGKGIGHFRRSREPGENAPWVVADDSL